MDTKKTILMLVFILLVMVSCSTVSLAYDYLFGNNAINVLSGGFQEILGTDNNGNDKYEQAENFTYNIDFNVNIISIAFYSLDNTPNGTFHLRIETNNAGSPSGTLANANADISFIKTDVGASYPIWHNFTFNATIPLIKNTNYWMTLTHNESVGAPSKRWHLGGSTDGSYDGNLTTSKDDGAWAILGTAANEDLGFLVYGSDKAASNATTITLNSPDNNSINTSDTVILNVTLGGENADALNNVTFYLRSLSQTTPITSVVLNSPNGGETWSGIHPITWSTTGCTGIESVNIYYGTGGDNISEWNPASSSTIAASINCSFGTYDWNTSDITDGSTYRIKIKSTADSDIYDFSANFFTINNTSPTADSVNQNYNLTNGSYATYNWTGLSDGTYEWYAFVTNSYGENTTSDKWNFIVDTAGPIITTDGIGLNKTFATYSSDYNFTAQINASDANLYSVNVTFNGSSVFGTTSLDTTPYVYNLSQNISDYSPGVYNITFKACDGHTALSLKDEWDYDIGLSGLTFKDKKKWYRINPTNNDLFESISTKKLKDRYSFEYSKSVVGKLLNPEDKYVFVVESSEHIDIISRPNSKYNAWLVIPTIGSTGRWIDFNLNDADDAKYTVKRLNDRQVEVTITNVPKDLKELVFESTGELNCVTEHYKFYVYNYTTSHDLTVLETSIQVFTLNITKDSDYITDGNATLHWNGTAYNSTKTTNGSYFLFSKTLTMPSITANTNITFNWTYTLVGNTNKTNITSDYTQQIYNIDMDDCSVYSIVALNFTLVEESNNASINGSMDFTFSLVGEGTTINYSTSVTNRNWTAFCIPTNDVSFTAQLQSEYSATDYESHTYFAYNLAIDNTTNNIIYYLTNGTTIVEFTVLDQNGDKVENAYIKIKKYDIGTGTYKTIETLKTDNQGKALGNIILDTEWYEFVVEYNGIVYLEDGPTKITSTSRTFRINLLSDFFDRYTDVIYGITSTLNYTYSTGNIRFTWSDPDGNYHYGCLKVTKETLAGNTLINETCVASTAGTILVNINSTGPINGTYAAIGYIKFDEPYVLRTWRETWGSLSETFGSEGLFYGFLIILTLAMVGIFAPKVAIILAVIGLVFSSILGFFHMNPSWIIALVIAAGLTVYRMRDN